MPKAQRVYVGNIPIDAQKRDLEKFFKGYGKLNDIVVIKGYGFVEFDDVKDADDACEDLDGKEMDGGKVKVEVARRDPKERYGYRRNGGRDYRDRGYEGSYRGDRRGGMRRGPPGPRTGYRLMVANISSRTSWQDLKDYFRTAGEITYTNVERSGDGIVEFRDRRGLEYALKYREELELDGKKLKVREDGQYRSKRESRSRTRSRTKSDSRSRTRSRSTSRSKSKTKSRSGSNSRSRSREHVRSERKGKNRGNRNNRSKSRTVSKSRSRSREDRYTSYSRKERKGARSRSMSRSRSRD